MNDELKKCPFCAELIQPAAVLCKHCNSRLDTTIDASSSPKSAAKEPFSEPKWGKGTVAFFGLIVIALLFSFGSYNAAMGAAMVAFIMAAASLVGFFIRRFRRRCVIGLAASFLVFCIGAFNGGNQEPADVKKDRLAEEAKENKLKRERNAEREKAKAAKRAVETPSIGEEGILNRDAYLANSENAMQALAESYAKNDKYGFAELLMNGSAAKFPRGTRVLVLGGSGPLHSNRKLRVLSGKHLAEIWYTPYEFLSRGLSASPSKEMPK